MTIPIVSFSTALRSSESPSSSCALHTLKDMECFMILFVVSLAFVGAALSEESSMPRPMMDFPLRDEMTKSNHWNMPSDHPIRMHLEATPGKFLGRVQNAEEVEDLRQKLRQEDWNQFTPPPITEVQCHVEFQVTKSLPGRCTKLGGHIPACQTEEYVEIDYNECS